MNKIMGRQRHTSNRLEKCEMRWVEMSIIALQNKWCQLQTMVQKGHPCVLQSADWMPGISKV